MITAHHQRLGFAEGAFERAARHRDDSLWLDAARKDDASRTVLICKDTPVIALRSDGSLAPLFTLDAAAALGPSEDSLFLGLHEETALFAGLLPENRHETLRARTDIKLIDMRSLAMQGVLTPAMEAALGTAKALFSWHQRHRFCSACGAGSTLASAGWKRVCPACGTEHFPRTDPVVIMLAVRGDRCLMGRAPQFPEGRYSCLAGFMEPGETIIQAVRREIAEETGVRVGDVRLLFDQPWPFPSSLMIGCIAEAESDEIILDPAELADARWFSKQEVAAILSSTHPGGLTAPPSMAIAHHIMRIFAES